MEIRDGLRAGEPYGRYFKDEVKQQLVQQFGEERVSEGGLQVYTTIDLPMQQAAEAAVQKSLAEIDRTPRPRESAIGAIRLQAALIAIDPASGAGARAGRRP